VPSADPGAFSWQRKHFTTELASGRGRTAMAENGPERSGCVVVAARADPCSFRLRSFEVASFHGGIAVPDTEFDPRRLKGIALCRRQQWRARMVETE